MFDRIAGSYDLLNSVMTAGLQPQRAFGRDRTIAVQRERRARHGHGLDQLGAVVEGVDQLRDAGLRIEAAADETEGADRVAVEFGTHGDTPEASADDQRLRMKRMTKYSMQIAGTMPVTKAISTWPPMVFAMTSTVSGRSYSGR